MEWVTDPHAWVGLATLIVLEIILGIDNLVFIAILADKLPPHQRNRARIIGLSLALGMRLVLLASIAWVVTLTTPLFSVLGAAFSGRDLILLAGGLFLIFKATMELHARLEGPGNHGGQGRIAHAVFWQVIVQIVVLDAVFSLDSVITAVGMVDELAVMMIAVVIAMIVMMVAAKPLMSFVSRHPTVVILCLGFLMMIGFSLVVEGFGFHIPKGYLYAAIAFSIMIEAFNQIARRNRQRLAATSDLRERAANAVLALLGGPRRDSELGETVDVIAAYTAAKEIFAPEQKQMIEGVLALDQRPAKSIMTPRIDVDWLDLDEPEEELRRRIQGMTHSRVPLGRGSLDNFIGVAVTKDLLRDLVVHGRIDLEKSVHQPLVVHKSVSVLRLMEQLRHSPLQMAAMLDEYGSLEGIVTPTDILEAIAGEFVEEGEEPEVVEQAADGSWLVDGSIEIRRISTLIGADLVDKTDHYSTLAGYILWQLGHLPTEGERIEAGGFVFEVVAMEDHSIAKVRIMSSANSEAAPV